jgi:uncharacterized protein (DUF2267 family)
MQGDEFIAAVKQSTGLPTTDDAARAVRATLGVLGQRLEGGEPQDLASQLPAGLKEYLPARGAGERFDVEAFYERVAADEGGDVTVSQARQHARATAKGLETALSDGEWRNFTSQLPADFADFLSTDTTQNH